MKYWIVIVVATWGVAFLFLALSIFASLYRDVLEAQQKRRDDLVLELVSRRWSLMYGPISKKWLVMTPAQIDNFTMREPFVQAEHSHWQTAIRNAVSPEPTSEEVSYIP